MLLNDNPSTSSPEPSHSNENPEMPSTSVYEPGNKPEINTQREVPDEMPYRGLPNEV